VEIIEERKRLRERVIECVKEWASNLPFKASVVLIGSYARGDFNLWSDVDVLLIADLHGNPLERLKSIDAPPGFEVIPLTLEEFEKLLSKRNPLAVDTIVHGIIVRDDFCIGKLVEKYRRSMAKDLEFSTNHHREAS